MSLPTECCWAKETKQLLLFKKVKNWSISVYREVQGPVMALAAIEGLLIVGWGSRLDSFAWKGQRLETTCFHEARVLITSISMIKRYVVLGDMHKSITFLKLAEDTHSFQNLSKVIRNTEPARSSPRLNFQFYLSLKTETILMITELSTI